MYMPSSLDPLEPDKHLSSFELWTYCFSHTDSVIGYICRPSRLTFGNFQSMARTHFMGIVL